jgi:hypothetical protein
MKGKNMAQEDKSPCHCGISNSVCFKEQCQQWDRKNNRCCFLSPWPDTLKEIAEILTNIWRQNNKAG